jgi:thioredoxin reductase (NADPH)
VQEIRSRPNVEVRLETEVVDGAGDGDGILDRVVLEHRPTNTRETAATDALFVLIGVQPRTECFSGTLQRDPKGFIVTGRDLYRASARLGRVPMPLETSLPGVFAVGDVRLGSTKRIASAVGEGAMVVEYVHKYLETPIEIDDATARSGAPRETPAAV